MTKKLLFGTVFGPFLFENEALTVNQGCYHDRINFFTQIVHDNNMNDFWFHHDAKMALHHATRATIFEITIPWTFDFEKLWFWLATAFTRFNFIEHHFVGLFDIKGILTMPKEQHSRANSRRFDQNCGKRWKRADCVLYVSGCLFYGIYWWKSLCFLWWMTLLFMMNDDVKT